MNRIQSLPEHVAIIMDGNGRWAQRRGLARIEGHRQGADSVRDVVRASRELGLKALTLYAFSSQNWQRPVAEVRALMELLRDYLLGERAEILDNNIRLVTIGDESRLPAFVREPIDELKVASANNDGMILCLALSYGGREAIVDAARRLAEQLQKGEIRLQDINTLSFAESLSTHGLPDLDLVIRTSGEERLSNFLLWESAYASSILPTRSGRNFAANSCTRRSLHSKGAIDASVSRRSSSVERRCSSALFRR